MTIPVEVTIRWNNASMVADVTEKVASRIYDDIKKQVEKKVIPALEGQVNLAIKSVLDQNVQPTDRFGEPTGAMTSIRELLMQDAEQWLNEKVDEYGRTGSSSYRKVMTRAEYLFKQILKSDSGRTESPIAKMAKDALKAQVGDVTEMVQQAVQEQIARKLK